MDVRRIHISATIQQTLSDMCTVTERSPMQRQILLHIPPMQIRPLIHQIFGNICVTMFARPNQWRPTAIVLTVDVITNGKTRLQQ